jgi:hypothetical protein
VSPLAHTNVRRYGSVLYSSGLTGYFPVIITVSEPRGSRVGPASPICLLQPSSRNVYLVSG